MAPLGLILLGLFVMPLGIWGMVSAYFHWRNGWRERCKYWKSFFSTYGCQYDETTLRSIAYTDMISRGWCGLCMVGMGLLCIVVGMGAVLGWVPMQ